MGNHKRPRGSVKNRKPDPHDLMYALEREGDEEYYVMTARSALMAPMVLLHACLAEKSYAAAEAQFAACLAAAMMSPAEPEAAIKYAVETAERAKAWHDKNIKGIGAESGEAEGGEASPDETASIPTVEFPAT